MTISFKNSFKITGRGVIVEIQHNKNGLASGLKLKSKQNGEVWEVKNRLVYSHVENHKLFEIEKVSPVFLTFAHIEKLENSKLMILDSEANNIYQYLIKNLSSENEKPKEGDYFEIFE